MTLKFIELFVEEIKKTDSLNPEIIDLNVGCAYHSTYVNHAASKFAKKLHIDVVNGKSPLISTVTGDVVGDEVIRTGEYWKQNVSQPVLFSKAIKKAGSMFPQNIFVEIGPSPVLRSHIANILTKKPHLFMFFSMKRNEEITTLASTLCLLYENNVNLNWTKIHQCKKEVTDIPTHNLRKHRNLYKSQDTLA
jgi:acyl transferase domain-containing protein